MNIVAIIPARGGSKGVPRKNIRLLAGKPLITYSIEAAIGSQYLDIDNIIISTDDKKIADVGHAKGVTVIKRPASLSGDESLVMDAVRFSLDQLKKEGKEYDILVLLEPTAPLRTSYDIDSTIIKVLEGADSAATFSETEVPPTRIWSISEEHPKPYIKGSDPFLPRQMQDKGYFLNGMVYVLKIALLNTLPKATSFLLGNAASVVIPRERAIDIDTEQDFFIAEVMIKQNQ